MKKLLLRVLLGLLVLVGLYDFFPIHYVSKPLTPEYNEIFSIVKANCSEEQYRHPNQVIVRLVNLNEEQTGEIGWCGSTPFSYKIVFDEKFWNKADDTLKYELMAHEMTHCLFGRGHSEDSYNYMFYGLNTHNLLSKEETTEQFMDVIKEECP